MISDMNLKQEIPRFFEEARQGLLTQYRVQIEALSVEIEALSAKSFNIFRFPNFRFINLNENRMSDVFAYLLSPDEAHGQGELFLREFLLDVAVDWFPEIDWSSVCVRREVQTTEIENDKRRIDIVIVFRINDGRAAVAVENKPREDSTDEERQLYDYAQYLESRYKSRFKLIYLTPDERDPSENSITCKERKGLAEKFAKASIQKWANGWLKRAEDEVKAERVRWFVSDFRKALIESLPAQEK